MAKNEFRDTMTATAAVQRRLLDKFTGSDRCLVTDSWFTTVDAVMMLKKNGLHVNGMVKGNCSLFPVETLRDYTPIEFGETLIYEAKSGGEKLGLYAVGIRAGKGKVNMHLTTCGTSHIRGRSRGSFARI